MNNDELQVLGAEKKQRKNNKVKIAIIALIALLAIGGGICYYVTLPKQLEKVKTGKKMGEPTIIPELQHAVDSLLRDELEMIDGLQGQVIVMEVQTGEVLALSGLERNFEGKYQPCRNFAYQQELGALTMAASYLALLEIGVDSGYVVHTGNGVTPVDEGLVMRDHNWRRGGYGDINLSTALEISSNIGIASPVSNFFMGRENDFYDILNKMSFGQPSDIDGIEGLHPSSYSSPKDADWTSYKIWWSAIGYERKIAPIQMLTFYNAIANNGKMVKPTLKTGEIEIINPQIASPQNIQNMQTVLRHVVSQGLGRKAGSSILPVAGKTGTSLIEEYDYYNEVGTPLANYQLAFCGYFPADEPKYSIIVSMNKLGLPASGGGMAGVVFHNIVEWMIVQDMCK